MDMPEGTTETEPAKTHPGQTRTNQITGPVGDQKLDRPIDTERIISDNQAQVLTEIEACETQKLDFTKETRIPKQNKPIRAAKAQLAQGNRLITASIPGISATEANKLVEQAFANGRDQAYISRLVRYVTGNPAIRIPAAVLTTLVKSNEDRLPSDQSPAPGHISKRRFEPRLSTDPCLKPGLTAHQPLGRKKIDFSKYAPFAPVLPGAAPLGYPEPSGRSSSSAAERSAQPGNTIDPHLKYSLQEFDSRLAIYVRHLVVEEDLLKIGFFGAKRPQATELAAWLSSVKIYYPEVRAIQILEPSF
jgi:hypothetical protein